MNTINKLSCGVSIHEEISDGKKVFVAECSELGINDFGESMNEALSNLKSAIELFLEESPEKKQLLEKPEPVFVTRLFL
jgi:predicted RNase H-like HicB family nuclease